MTFFNKVHFDDIVEIAGVQISAKLTSDYDRIWSQDVGEPFEFWHYHLTMSNQKLEVDRDKGIDTGYTITDKYTNKPEYHVPYISETGFRSDFFHYDKKPSSINTADIKEIIEGRITVLLGGAVDLLKYQKIKPVEVVSKIPEEAWEDTDE